MEQVRAYFCLSKVPMALLKKLPMTGKKVAANRRNQNLCHVPLTEEGRDRIRLCGEFRVPTFAKSGGYQPAAEDKTL